MDLSEELVSTVAGPSPRDWCVVDIEEIVSDTAPVCYGVIQVGSHVQNGVPIVPIKYVKEISHAPLHRSSPSIEGQYSKSRVEAGDVLISVKGTIGRVGIVPDGFKGNISRELARLRVKPQYCAKYVAHQLEAPATQARVMASVVGTTRLEFSIATLRKFALAVPPTRREQEAIADALSDVDALIESLERLINKKRLIQQGIMHELLTGKRRLPGFEIKPGFKQTEIGLVPIDWTVAYVGDLVEIGTGSKNTQDRIEDGRYPFFVRSQTVERINSFSFDGEAVLTAGDGVGTGKVFHYVNGKFDVHQRVYRMSDFTDQIDGFFFYLIFSNMFYTRIMQMTAKSSVDSVRMDMISKMLIPLPDKCEQSAIASCLRDTAAAIDSLEARLSKTRMVKQGMMQQLLTGRVRLI